MKRICHITTVHPRYDNRILQKECRSLAKEGYKVYLIVNDDYADEEVDGVSIVSMHKKRKNRWTRILFAPLDAYKEARKLKADLYHLHDPELLFIAKRLKKISPVIFDSHEFTAEQILEKFYIPKVLRYFLAKLYRNLERKIINKIDGLIVPCTYAGKDYFEGAYKKVAYVNNVPSITKPDFQEVPYDKRKIEALYLGGITLQRGAREMVQAAYQAKICLNMGGRFSPAELENELEDMEEYRTVNYLGILDRKQVRDVLGDSKIGICLLKNSGQYRKLDNLPTKIYEYMAAGIPVIASDFPYYKKVIDKYQAGICVNPEDIKAIAEAIGYLIEHPDKAKKMGKNGRRLVEEKFNWEQEKQHLFELYRTILYE